MSHIYDALRKSGEGDPERGRGGERIPPPDGAQAPAGSARPAADRGTLSRGLASQVEAPERLVPAGRVEGALFAGADIDLLHELESLRSSIEVTLGRSARRVVGFTGSAPDEGTTTVAAHYAYLLARVVGKRVLLVDADMPGSNIGLSSAFEDREGFAELLARNLPLEKVILATEEPNLHFLPAGRDHVHHVEAVSAGGLRPLFERCALHYEAVVVDIPPVLKYPEAPLIAAACDGVVLVVRAHRTRRHVVRRALAELNFAKCRVLGTVLNARRETLPRFLRERV